MGFLEDRKKRKICIWIASVFLVIAIVIGACAIYLGDYYRADMKAIKNFETRFEYEHKMLNGNMIFEPDDAAAGFIFYPGGKVEFTAYIPLMMACASNGILCVLVEMPFNIAIFNGDAAEGIKENYPEIEHWYIGGHSLGGYMAADYLGERADEYDGLVLLAAYSGVDLSGTELEVLSVYGSNDGVMNSKRYEEGRANLPTDFKEVVLDGGCHAYFGMYGAQSGDGIPDMTNEEQINLTASIVAEFVFE